ncbi:MAG TPA: hypothetical protein VF784_00940 [Anaerolineales bacterium]
MHGVALNYLTFFAAGAALALIGVSILRDRARRDREAFDRAVPGVARVLKVANTTPSRSYGGIIMDLLIQVHRPGVAPYELSTMWSVQPGEVSRLQVGQSFAVKIDPLNRDKIYSGETWTHSLGVMKKPISMNE